MKRGCLDTGSQSVELNSWRLGRHRRTRFVGEGPSFVENNVESAGLFGDPERHGLRLAHEPGRE